MVVIGGGIVGCSVLYHPTRMGWIDVVLLERDELTSGSTWHAAGNCPNFSTSWNIMKLQSYSNRLYRELPHEVDDPIDHRASGSIRLAHTPERIAEFRHVAGMANAQDLPFEILSANEMRERHPFLDGARADLRARRHRARWSMGSARVAAGSARPGSCRRGSPPSSA